MRKLRRLPKAVEKKIDRDPETGCWFWLGSLSPKGYGRVSVQYQAYMAHRYVYERYRGKVPEGMELDHLCRVRDCVNPDHLEAVTHQENVARGNAGKTNREKTHCNHGHPFDEQNTGYHKNNRGRYCRECRRQRARAHYERVKAARSLRA